MTRTSPRRFAIALIAIAAAALGGCGSEAEPAQAPLGSPENPIVSNAQRDGTDPDAPGKLQPGYRDLVANQSSRPEYRDSPCALVTKRQAEQILGGTLLDPLEAPQGPTCIYRDRDGQNFVSLAVEDQPFSAVRERLEQRRRVSVGEHSAYCGVHGMPMLYLPIDRGRVLSVTAQCEVAKRFATSAVPHLDG